MNKQKGFTMIELLVVFFILTTGILVVYSSASYSFKHTAQAHHKITAFYLSQEGIDLVRNIRDNNMIKGDYWLEGIPHDNPCFTIDYLDNINENCHTPELYFNKGYSHDNSGETTKLTRKIIVEEKTDDVFKIQSIVSWGEENEDEIIVFQHFYNFLDTKEGNE